MDTISKKSYTVMVILMILVVLTLLLAGCASYTSTPVLDTPNPKIDTSNLKIITGLPNSSVSDDLDTAIQEMDQLER